MTAYSLMLGPVDLADDIALGGEQIEWVDQYDWDPVAQEQERSLNGKLHVQEGVKVYGRPITLQSNGGAWFALAKVQAVQALAAVPGQTLLLKLPGGAEHYVTFNRTDGAAVQAKPVHRFAVHGQGDKFEMTIRLITVAPPPAPEPDPEPEP